MPTIDSRGVRAFAAIFVALAAGCGGGGSGGTATPRTPVTPTPAAHLPEHIVVIIQENRTVDNLFNGFPGADTVRSGLNSKGETVPLHPVPLDSKVDVGHGHGQFNADFDNGKMDGWDTSGLFCELRHNRPCTGPLPPYGFVPRAQVAPYWDLAQQFILADHVLQTNEGSSFPAHQYLIAGQSGGGDPNHLAIADDPDSPTGGCNRKNITAPTIDMTKPFPQPLGRKIFPCLNYQTVLDRLSQHGRTWRYYTPLGSSQIWTAPMAISHIWFSDAAANIVSPQTQILTDIADHKLANVSFVVPELSLSDHAGWATLQGPDWVATVVNAVGESIYWKSSAILIVWDDWGGWYDHYIPTHPADSPQDPNEYGFRVPLIVAGPYVAHQGYVDHTPRDMTAIVHFIEDDFGLPSLGQRDATTDDLFSDFSFTSTTPATYRPIATGGYTPSWFLQHPTDTRPVDD